MLFEVEAEGPLAADGHAKRGKGGRGALSWTTCSTGDSFVSIIAWLSPIFQAVGEDGMQRHSIGLGCCENGSIHVAVDSLASNVAVRACRSDCQRPACNGSMMTDPPDSFTYAALRARCWMLSPGQLED